MSRDIVIYSPDDPMSHTVAYKGHSTKNLWNNDSVKILLTEYKKLKDALSIRRSSSMPKSCWESIKRKLHEAGFKDIRHQHVVKKFSTLKLHYKEWREGLPVKQRIYNFLDILADILDDDPYIAFAKPTKRMKEKRLVEHVQHSQVQPENYITLEFTDLQSDGKVTEIIQTSEVEHLEEGQYVDAAILLGDQEIDENPQMKVVVEDVDQQSKKRRKSVKSRRRDPPALQEEDRPGMPSWICYLERLLRKEEKQRANHLWRLHEEISQAQKAKVDLLERLVSSITSGWMNKSMPNNEGVTLYIPPEKIAIENKNEPKNIIIVDEEGSIYLKPTEIMKKRKGPNIEYILPHKILKTNQEVQFLEAGLRGTSELQLEFIGEGEEIIIENCEDSQIYQMEPVSEEVVEESNVISHVEIVEQQVEEDVLVDHSMDTIEFIQTVNVTHQSTI